MRPAVTLALTPSLIIALILANLLLMAPLAGCTNRTGAWDTPTPTPTRKGPAVTPTVARTTPVPTTPGPLVQVTPITTETVTPPSVQPTITPAQPELTRIDVKDLAFIFNRTAYTYTLENPPLRIDYTLTVPNITKTRVMTDPVSGNDRTITISYPDPGAEFEVTVMDLDTGRVIAQDGYGGGLYDVSYSKKLWVRYPGRYYIEFWGDRVRAHVEFYGTGDA